MDPSADRPLKITSDELDRAVPLSMRGFAQPFACAVCGIMNDAGAIECRSCGEPFAPEAAGRASRPFVPRCPPEEIQFARWMAGALFGVSLIGVLAPLVMVLAALLFVGRGRALVQAGSAFVGLACFAVVLSLIYSGMAAWALLN